MSNPAEVRDDEDAACRLYELAVYAGFSEDSVVRMTPEEMAVNVRSVIEAMRDRLADLLVKDLP